MDRPLSRIEWKSEKTCEHWEWKLPSMKTQMRFSVTQSANSKWCNNLAAYRQTLGKTWESWICNGVGGKITFGTCAIVNASNLWKPQCVFCDSIWRSTEPVVKLYPKPLQFSRAIPILFPEVHISVNIVNISVFTARSRIPGEG